jgi:hypothetical protein
MCGERGSFLIGNIEMAYFMYITRADEWYLDDSNPIQLEEWVGLVASDPELESMPVLKAELPDGREVKRESPGLALWSGNEFVDVVALEHRNGSIAVKYPDDQALRKMAEIAEKLGARVQGEEGELYGVDGEVLDKGPNYSE